MTYWLFTVCGRIEFHQVVYSYNARSKKIRSTRATRQTHILGPPVF